LTYASTYLQRASKDSVIKVFVEGATLNFLFFLFFIVAAFASVKFKNEGREANRIPL
jgi:hypothetical protein